MSFSRREFALVLAMTPGIGGKSVVKVLARNDITGLTPEQFLALPLESKVEEYKLKPSAARSLSLGANEIAGALELIQRLTTLGVDYVTGADANYPGMIEELDQNAPAALFFYGNKRLLGADTFCVLSSRNTSRAGLDLIEKLSEEHVLAGRVLVSGHDRPEYQRSAVVPLRWGAPRILCLDRGVFEALGKDLKQEPFRAARLWRYQFDPSTDLVVSPFRPEAICVGINNQVRDRLVASLSKRLDFVEVSQGGNMDKVAHAALRAGRPVRISPASAIHDDLVAAGASSLAIEPSSAP